MTCQCFGRLADSSVRESRVQRLAEEAGRFLTFDGDQSPAESADKSAQSKACGGGLAAPGHRRPSVVEDFFVRFQL